MSTDHALAAPVLWPIAPRHWSYAGSLRSWGIGSQVHLRAPVLASYARTSPLAGLGRLLSATEDPVMTNPLIATGGDVIENAPGSIGAIRSPDLRSTRPSRPKPAKGRPDCSSSARSCVRALPPKIRRRHLSRGGEAF